MLSKDPNFKPDKFIGACHIICNDKMLLLLRNEDKPQGGTYGVPAGKIDKDESPIQTVIREVKEETGLDVKEDQLEFQKIFQVVYDEYGFAFYLYNLYLDEEPEIKVNTGEHQSYRWEKPEDSLKLDLIGGEDEVIKEVFNLD
jgi:8-oxo-dGTP pyrophosphatase MutT (NUDIX family)